MVRKKKRAPATVVPHVADLYSEWFLDYASYVILERAVPSIEDGLKPVQRRILHSMREMEDGRYNKVANIVGSTMKYHPHGDAAIADALIQLGQKDLLIDCQGNWGNPATGDPAAAARYIEARLSQFALEVIFNSKTTLWVNSYDGRNREPVSFPVKFPLLLAHGAEGIAVGLSTKILPHNFNELVDASIDALRRKKTNILPDFPSGGIADCNDYNEGMRGGRVRIRAKIEILPRRRLAIVEIPFGSTTTSLIDSILAANEKGKIKINKIEDNTAEEVEIIVHLPPGTDSPQAIQALYAFTDCEVSIAPNTCVIDNMKPRFLSVNDLLKRSAFKTKELLGQELEIRLNELLEQWHSLSLERIFIAKKVYRKIETKATWDGVINVVSAALAAYQGLLKRKITKNDILRLLEIRIKRISKYDLLKAVDQIAALERDIDQVQGNLKGLTRYTVRYLKELKNQFGENQKRRTSIEKFDRIIASKVAVAGETLFLNAQEGFAGVGLKRERAIEKCSRMDDIIVFRRDGTMQVSRVTEKSFVGKNPAHIAVFNKEVPVVYSMIYRDGKSGRTFAKKFRVSGVTRDKLYDLAQGNPGTRILFFNQITCGESEGIVHLHLDPQSKARNKIIDFDFSQLALKGRDSRGNIVTRHKVQRVSKNLSG